MACRGDRLHLRFGIADTGRNDRTADGALAPDSMIIVARRSGWERASIRMDSATALDEMIVAAD
jgi:hypothetical protein